MKRKVMLAFPTVVGVASALAPITSFAAETAASGDAVAAATEAVGTVASITSLFTTYPMNVFLGMGIAAAALGLFARAKRTSKG